MALSVYEVLKSEPRYVSRFWRHVQRRGAAECWVWSGRCSHGYGMLHVRGADVRAHRIAWMLAHGCEVPVGMLVLHSCDNRPCCNPAHLRVGSHADNAADRVVRGRGSCGVEHGAKVSAGVRFHSQLLSGREVAMLFQENPQVRLSAEALRVVVLSVLEDGWSDCSVALWAPVHLRRELVLAVREARGRAVVRPEFRKWLDRELRV